MNWTAQFDKTFGWMGSFWEKWANGSLPDQGGISEDLKAFIQTEVIEKLIEEIPEQQRGDPFYQGNTDLKQQLRKEWL